MSLAILFHFLCTQHVSGINITIIRSLRLCCWITTSVVLFSVRCVLELWCGSFWVVPVLQDETQLFSLSLLCVGALVWLVLSSARVAGRSTTVLLMSETCWAHKKWNKATSDIKLVFHSSTITMMQSPINIRLSIDIYHNKSDKCEILGYHGCLLRCEAVQSGSN